jgi:hypothetical protein
MGLSLDEPLASCIEDIAYWDQWDQRDQLRDWGYPDDEIEAIVRRHIGMWGQSGSPSASARASPEAA